MLKAIKWHLAPSFLGQVVSYSLTQGHSFMRMGNVVNTWMHDVSLSCMISLGPSCARQCVDLRELSLPGCLQEKSEGYEDLRWCVEGGKPSMKAGWLCWDVCDKGMDPQILAPSCCAVGLCCFPDPH